MKVKVKNTIKEIIDYTLTNEFKALVIIMLFMFLCVSLFWGAICTVMTNDITEVATEQKEENIKLQAEYDKLSQEYARMKMAYEETYELFTTCQESTSWYEQFYYDNVDPTTGEIEGEYYE